MGDKRKCFKIALGTFNEGCFGRWVSDRIGSWKAKEERDNKEWLARPSQNAFMSIEQPSGSGTFYASEFSLRTNMRVLGSVSITSERTYQRAKENMEATITIRVGGWHVVPLTATKKATSERTTRRKKIMGAKLRRAKQLSMLPRNLCQW